MRRGFDVATALGAVILAGAGSACAPASAPAPASVPASAPASASAPALDRLEHLLSSSRTVRLRARVATSGRIESHFEGTLLASTGNRMRIAMQGAFGGKDVDLLFTCDGRRMRGGAKGGAPFDFDAPPGLREGFAVAFTRMGLTHELARLSGGKPPEYVDGSARDHLAAVGATDAPGEALRGAATVAWTWGLFVDHQRTADETLWLDARTGVPLRRRVVVHFPEGDMTVGEQYEELAFDEPVPDDTFALALTSPPPPLPTAP